MSGLSKSLILVVAVALIPACGTSEVEFKNLSQRIINGDDDTSEAHQAVVLVNMGFGMCSGTLITPRVVMTAGHCLDGMSASRVTVGFGNTSSDMQWRNAEELKVHPQYDRGNWVVPPTNDISLLRMDDDAPTGITPIPFMPHSLTVTEADIGSPLEYVGFGQTENDTTGIKKAVTMTLDYVCIGPDVCEYGGGIDAAVNSIGQNQTDGGACSGDSGGPAFMWRNNKEYAAGITSYGDQYCTQYGISTKADEFEDFINDFVGVTGELGDPCSSDSQCDTGHCASGVCCQEACDDACMACNLQGSVGSCLALADGSACGDDSNVCDGGETCQDGVCLAGGALNCDDGSVCTADSCDPATGCVHVAMDCNDDDSCTTDSCDPAAGCQNLPAADGSSCADANVCNGQETCQAGVCSAGSPLDCHNDDPCTDESCHPASGCQYNPVADGAVCASTNQCLAGGTCQSGACQGGAPVTCDDHNACTQDSCLPDAGCVFDALPNGSACGGGLCGQGSCSEGECQLAEISCDDQNPCTEDHCDPQLGCVYDAVPDELNLECGDCMVCKSAQCTPVENCESETPSCASSGSHPASGLGFGLLLLGLCLRRRRP